MTAIDYFVILMTSMIIALVLEVLKIHKNSKREATFREQEAERMIFNNGETPKDWNPRGNLTRNSISIDTSKNGKRLVSRTRLLFSEDELL